MVLKCLKDCLNYGENLKHNQVMNDDGDIFDVPTYEKNIRCTEIL